MSSRTGKRITIKDVAKCAGVSTQTISRVINGHPDVSAETRDRVKGVICSLGYQPNLIARSLSSNTSGIIGVVAPKDNWYMVLHALPAIQQQAREMGYFLATYFINPVNDEEILPAIDQLVKQQVEGIIWMVPEIGDNHSDLIAYKKKLQIPFIFLTMNPRTDISVVTVDNYKGAKLAVTHLLEQGCRKIGIVTGPLLWWEARERKIGWEKTLLAAGIIPQLEWISEGDWSPSSGEVGFKKLLNSIPEMDGVLFCNDLMASGGIKAAFEMGIRIPADVCIVGFDNRVDIQLASPSLSSINQPMEELGVSALQELTHIISASKKGDLTYQPKTILIQPNLVVRSSSLSLSNGIYEDEFALTPVK